MSTPHNSTPDNATPDNSTPDNSTPDNSTPDNSTPDNATPNNSTPDNATPNNSTSDNSKLDKGTHNKSKGSSKSSELGGSSNNNSKGHKALPSNDESNDSAVIGSVIGVGFVLLILVIICLIWRKKKRKHRYYYGEPPTGKANNYYNTRQSSHPNWQNGQSLHGQDHGNRYQSSNGMGPPSGSWNNGMGPPSGSWGTQYPLMNSGDMSSNYSLGGNPMASPSPGLALSLSGGSFNIEELASATNGFSKDKIIGQGGFGYVYKGTLSSGKVVAIKCLKSGSGQGEREFQAEIEIISRVHHRHLVSLVGYCISGGQRMLVYEFVPNGTLEHHLHGKGVATMDWPTRMRIALGSTKGLAYLHEDCHPRIIHRDIKAANVLLDDSFEAKVADFGLAKLTTDNNTHVSTRVMGTFGYLAPEYASSGKLTEKSDVFSFGVMLLELITGKRPVDPTNAMDDSLVDWARPLLSRALEDGNFGELPDPFLEGNYNLQEMNRMTSCAAASICHSAKKRAKMIQIVRSASLDDMKQGAMKPPGPNKANNSSNGSSDYDTMQYNADMIKFRQAIMSSQEFGDTN